MLIFLGLQLLYLMETLKPFNANALKLMKLKGTVHPK